MLRIYSLLFIVLFASSCARVSTPTGGDKDVVAPELVSSVPVNQSIQVNTQEIVFTFDEYVKLNNIASQLVVSPALEEAPEFRIKKRSVHMLLKNPLEPNTTYNFNFGDAIVDVNEGNPLKNFSFVISTGDYLDSLEVGGTVENSYTGIGQKDFTAMLYADLGDSVPYLKKPLYLSKTDGTGNFKIKNLKAGNYRLLAINDQSKDYKFQPSEEVAFADSLVSPSADSAATGTKLRAFKELSKKLLVTNKKLENQQKIIAGISRPCKSCQLIEPSFQNLLYTQWQDADNDSLFAILKPYKDLDSVTFYLKADTGIVDTLQFYPGKVKDRDPAKLKFTPVTANGLAEGKMPLRFSFPEPIVNLETAEPVKLMRRDSTYFTARLLADSAKIGEYVFDFVAEFDSAFAIFWPDSNFIGLYNGYSVADTALLGVQKLEYYGNLIFNIDNNIGSSAILLFTDTKTKITKEVHLIPGDNKVEFLKIDPSVYQLAIVVDVNNNGIWDTGNLLEKIQPEIVINYKETVHVRSNWDMDLQWDVNLPETK